MRREEKRLAASAVPPPLRAPACSTASHACSARAVPSTLAVPSASARHTSAASARPRPDIAHSHIDRIHDHLGAGLAMDTRRTCYATSLHAETHSILDKFEIKHMSVWLLAKKSQSYGDQTVDIT